MINTIVKNQGNIKENNPNKFIVNVTPSTKTYKTKDDLSDIIAERALSLNSFGTPSNSQLTRLI